jgi:hypothetical protein
MFEKCQCEYPDDQYDLAMDETPSIGDVQRTIVQVDYSSKLSFIKIYYDKCSGTSMQNKIKFVLLLKYYVNYFIAILFIR